MNDCLFCKMVNNSISVPRVYEDDRVIVIRDINPQAPRHLLAIPRSHYPGIHLVPPEEHTLFQSLFSAIQAVVLKEGIAEEGYRLVINSGTSAGQSVDHIHVHILNGRTMHWPPG
ncbi:MAG: HIT domain-containing protein [Chitinispirillaceae bacterium]|nr:HIT domain-containing protein [Chitinispirillaceae bacterium]